MATDQNHGAGAPQKHLGAVEQPQAERPQRGPAVGRHLQHERRVASLFRTDDFSSRAVKNAARNPSTYRPSMAAARVPRNGPRIGFSGMNAAIISVYTGRRAEQVMNGAIRMVAMRSRLFSMVRVAMMAGTAQAYADSSGMNDFALQSDARHGAVGDQRRARQIAGVFQDADEQEQQQDLRQEYHHRSDAAPDPVDQQRTQRRSGSSVPIQLPEAVMPACTRSISGLRPAEDGLEHGHHHHRKNERPGNRMQEDPVQAARPERGRGRLIGRLPPDLRGPGAALRDVLNARAAEPAVH